MDMAHFFASVSRVKDALSGGHPFFRTWTWKVTVPSEHTLFRIVAMVILPLRITQDLVLHMVTPCQRIGKKSEGVTMRIISL